MNHSSIEHFSVQVLKVDVKRVYQILFQSCRVSAVGTVLPCQIFGGPTTFALWIDNDRDIFYLKYSKMIVFSFIEQVKLFQVAIFHHFKTCFRGKLSFNGNNCLSASSKISRKVWRRFWKPEWRMGGKVEACKFLIVISGAGAWRNIFPEFASTKLESGNVFGRCACMKPWLAVGGLRYYKLKCIIYRESYLFNTRAGNEWVRSKKFARGEWNEIFPEFAILQLGSPFFDGNLLDCCFRFGFSGETFYFIQVISMNLGKAFTILIKNGIQTMKMARKKNFAGVVRTFARSESSGRRLLAHNMCGDMPPGRALHLPSVKYERNLLFDFAITRRAEILAELSVICASRRAPNAWDASRFRPGILIISSPLRPKIRHPWDIWIGAN